MTFASADPVPSGLPFEVISVDGTTPSTIEQFLGETAFVIARGGAESHVVGLGITNERGVRFQEKDMAHDGKDVRTWQISQGPAGGFTAAATAAF